MTAPGSNITAATRLQSGGRPVIAGAPQRESNASWVQEVPGQGMWPGQAAGLSGVMTTSAFESGRQMTGTPWETGVPGHQPPAEDGEEWYGSPEEAAAWQEGQSISQQQHSAYGTLLMDPLHISQRQGYGFDQQWGNAAYGPLRHGNVHHSGTPDAQRREQKSLAWGLQPPSMHSAALTCANFSDAGLPQRIRAAYDARGGRGQRSVQESFGGPHHTAGRTPGTALKSRHADDINTHHRSYPSLNQQQSKFPSAVVSPGLESCQAFPWFMTEL